MTTPTRRRVIRTLRRRYRCTYCTQRVRGEAWMEHMVGAHPRSALVAQWAALVGLEPPR